MESPKLPIFTFVTILMIGLNSSSLLSEELYWKSMLPNTPLPATLQRLVINRDSGTKSSDSGGDAFFNPFKRSYMNFHTYRMNSNPNPNPNPNLNSNWTSFFLYGDILHHNPAKKVRLAFAKPTNKVGFLPRLAAKSTPFSSDKFPAILEKFSVKPESKLARAMKDTIESCEAPNEEGEKKQCATSLESMVDFAVSEFGHKVNIVSNEEVQKENKKHRQGYVIVSKDLKRLGDKHVVCHRQGYVYAVFYCHMLKKSEAYVVPMVGDDGSIAKALAVCHTDTSIWDPNYYGLRLLNVKPGTPVCHFLNTQAFIWFK